MQLEITEKKCRMQYPKLPSVLNEKGKYIICKTDSWGPFRIKINKRNKNAVFYDDKKQKYPLIYFTESELLIDMSSNPFSDKKYPLRYKIDYINGVFNWIELGKTNIAGSCEEEINQHLLDFMQKGFC